MLDARDSARHLAAAVELVDGIVTVALLVPGRASGVAVVLAEGVRRWGAAPAGDAVSALVRWLREAQRDVYVSSTLAPELAQLGPEEFPASLLALAIVPELGEYILWFRPAGAAWLDEELGAAQVLRGVVLAEMRRRSTRLHEEHRRLTEEHRAKDEFIAAVGHELRNPLNVLGGWLALLKSGSLGAREREHALEVIERNVNIQRKVVEDLLDSSRAARGQLVLDCESVELAPLIEECLDSAGPALESKSITLERSVAADLGVIRADAERLRQILANLTTNAVKFTPAGGKIRVCVSRIAGGVELSVTDTGVGIAPEFLPQVFEAFSQAAFQRRRSGGLGLGLRIVKHLVELHGGRVTAESAGLGQGATFRVFLPDGAAQTAPTVVKPATAHQDGASETRELLENVELLLVEDNEDSSEFLKILLERDGVRVTEVADAPTALALLERRHFRIVLSDVGLPEMDGFELIRRIRGADSPRIRSTPAVALTGYAQASDREAILKAGFQAHVAKPLNYTSLVTALSTALRTTG